MLTKCNALVTIPEGLLKRQIFTKDTMQSLEQIVNVTWNPQSRDYTEEELCEVIKGKHVCLTGWGTHKITAKVLNNANKLKFIGHMAGTIKGLVDEAFFNKGVIITNANTALAYSVAEYCLMVALMTTWDILGTIGKVKSKQWPNNNDVVDGLNGKTVGLLGYGTIAKRFISLLKTFDVKIYVNSGNCPIEEADVYGFELCSLEDVLKCNIISIHKTLTTITYHMLNKDKLKIIPDNAIVINTARGAVFDENDLIKELKKNRFKAVLDVFEQEPLPNGHILRKLPNVIITPHCAATSLYWRRQLPKLIIEDLQLFLEGKEPKNIIHLDKYRSMSIK